MIVPGEQFQPSLIFEEAGTHPRLVPTHEEGCPE